jgi:hypothetical protein
MGIRGNCTHRFKVAGLRFQQLGWVPTKMFFQGTIGENDNQLGTSREVYTMLGNQVVHVARTAFAMRPARRS